MARMNADECFSDPRKSALSAVKNLLVKQEGTIAVQGGRKQETTMIDSAAISSQTPTQASQPNNVWKCLVLSGPTDLSVEIDASPDIQTTCEQNPSSPDRTSTGYHPAKPPQPDAPRPPPLKMRPKPLCLSWHAQPVLRKSMPLESQPVLRRSMPWESQPVRRRSMSWESRATHHSDLLHPNFQPASGRSQP